MTDAGGLNPLTTGEDGILEGFGLYGANDRLLAALPVTQTYRLPPQIVFETAEATAAINRLTISPDALTAEFWARPFGEAGEFFSIRDTAEVDGGNELLSLSFSTVEGDSSLAFTILGQSQTIEIDPNLSDGNPHHIAMTVGNGETQLFVNGNQADSTPLSVAQLPSELNVIIGDGYVGSVDEIRIWNEVKSAEWLEKSAETYHTQRINFWPVAINQVDQLITDTSDLAAYWPFAQSDANSSTIVDQSGNAQTIQLSQGSKIAFQTHYTTLYTSGPVENDEVTFSAVDPNQATQSLIIKPSNTLILFDIDVSLEWDARTDDAFLQELRNSFERASELLFDVSNGQIALGAVNLFHNKLYWGSADVIVFADNGIRPSASIGGVLLEPTDDKTTDGKEIEDAYIPGHIRMGVVWDPYGEKTIDLGEEWSRAMAHELSHYLLFLFDNYLGYKGEEDGVKALGLIENCTESFMTNNIDPSYSEFRGESLWDETCGNTLANNETGRSDWETVTAFYPMLSAEPVSEGPNYMPLDVTALYSWGYEAQETVIPERMFDLRNATGGRERLGFGEVYLFREQGDDDPSNDILIPLGSPTGGGDRIRVRGAAAGDRLCVFANRSTEDGWFGCVDDLSIANANIPIQKRSAGVAFQPDIDVESIDGRQMKVTVSFEDPQMTAPSVQLFPQHYMSFEGSSPVQTLTPVGTDSTQFEATIDLILPTFELAIRVWDHTAKSGEREIISNFRLNPPEWGNFSIPLDLVVGVPDAGAQAGPIVRPTGGPIVRPTGGPIVRPTGGPIVRPTGGPIVRPTGGPIVRPTGGPIVRPTGGSEDENRENRVIRSAFAPILSADARVVIYNANGYFLDNGIIGLEALSQAPDLNPWLVPVGKAYHIQNDDEMKAPRFIALSYLQSDVPSGYEESLRVYFLPDNCPENDCRWTPIGPKNQPFIENMLVVPLETDADKIGQDGTYAILATIEMQALKTGMNLVSYPLLVAQDVSLVLENSSIIRYGDIYTAEVSATTPFTTAVVNDTINALFVRNGPGIAGFDNIGYIRRNEQVIVRRIHDNGWINIECPTHMRTHEALNRAQDEGEPRCWISGNSRYTTIIPSGTPESLTKAPNGSAETAIKFLPFHLYWVEVLEFSADKLYIAPLIHNPDGSIRGLD